MQLHHEGLLEGVEPQLGKLIHITSHQTLACANRVEAEQETLEAHPLRPTNPNRRLHSRVTRRNQGASSVKTHLRAIIQERKETMTGT